MIADGLDRARELEVFSAIAASGSFSSAGRSLSLTPSAVSRTVDRIEARLGARLILRTTRALTLTAEGQNLSQRGPPHPRGPRRGRAHHRRPGRAPGPGPAHRRRLPWKVLHRSAAGRVRSPLSAYRGRRQSHGRHGRCGGGSGGCSRPGRGRWRTVLSPLVALPEMAGRSSRRPTIWPGGERRRCLKTCTTIIA